MTKQSADRFWTIKVMLLGLLTLIGYMSAAVLRNYTMVSFPVVMSASFMAGAMIGVAAAPVIARLTRKPWIALNAAIGTAVATGVVAGAFFILNFALADTSTAHREQAVIERKYRETRYRQKRVSRNRYVRGEPYYEYYFDVRYANGATKAMLVRADRYRRLDAGDTINVDISRGLFGFPVVKK